MNRVLMDELLEGIEFVYKDELAKMNQRGTFDHNKLKWIIINRINKRLIQFDVDPVSFGPRLVRYIALVEPEILKDKKYGILLTKCISESGLPFNAVSYSKDNILQIENIDRMIKLYPKIVDNAVDYLTGSIKTSEVIIERVRNTLYSNFIKECVNKWTDIFNDDSLDIDNRPITPMELKDIFNIHDNGDEINSIIDDICDNFELLMIKAGEDVLLSEINGDINGFTTQLAIELKISELYVTSNDVMIRLFGEWECDNYYKLLSLLHTKLVTSLAYSLIDTVRTSTIITELGRESFNKKLVSDYLNYILNKEDNINE